ncbi:hypothetical protein [uncultured Flavobacterium sp.]|uniref:hypothetical protein n=1 Tax=uncultured Flavobacterium sp. TaxID=165435 RepID=UPI0025DC7BD5|nr:hypothetical protein [uncultured Flavobacterium sp.]
MKTKLLSIIILLTATAFGQEEPSSGKFSDYWYYGFGITGNTGYNISDNLRDAGVKRIPDVLPALFVGWTAAFTERLSLDMEFGVAGIIRNKKNAGSQLLQAPIRARFQYTAVKKEMFSLAAGVNFSIVGNDLTLWSGDTGIDMNDLDPEVNTGYIRLRNTQYFAGPSATVKLLDKGEAFLLLTLGYDFSLANAKWKSDYARLSNVVKEKNNQFFVGLAMPF